MRKSGWRWLGMAAVVLLAGGLAVLLVNTRTHFVNRWYDDTVLDNWNHYLPCDQWPTPDEVHDVIAQHQDVVRRIEAVHPGHAGVEVDEFTCPGRADIVIWYASHADRLQIEAIIGADRFFGMPYRLVNQ